LDKRTYVARRLLIIMTTNLAAEVRTNEQGQTDIKSAAKGVFEPLEDADNPNQHYQSALAVLRNQAAIEWGMGSDSVVARLGTFIPFFHFGEASKLRVIEETLQRVLNQVAKRWKFQVSKLDALEALRQQTARELEAAIAEQKQKSKGSSSSSSSSEDAKMETEDEARAKEQQMAKGGFAIEDEDPQEEEKKKKEQRRADFKWTDPPVFGFQRLPAASVTPSEPPSFLNPSAPPQMFADDSKAPIPGFNVKPSAGLVAFVAERIWNKKASVRSVQAWATENLVPAVRLMLNKQPEMPVEFTKALPLVLHAFAEDERLENEASKVGDRFTLDLVKLPAGKSKTNVSAAKESSKTMQYRGSFLPASDMFAKTGLRLASWVVTRNCVRDTVFIRQRAHEWDDLMLN
jgi:hypothetical protein